MRSRKRHQRGFCDAGCDLGDCGSIADAGDLLDCCGNVGSCDWPWKRQPATRPAANLNDPITNENALRERIRQAQEKARQND